MQVRYNVAMLNDYSYPIETAALHFLVAAFLLTLPYALYHYFKYGSVSKWRACILFSFIYYLLSAYYLIILPLPDPAVYTGWTNPPMQVVPFSFVRDIVVDSGFNLLEPSTYLATLKNRVILEPVFNVLMTVPFGVYLQYYFKRSFKQTLILSFCLSLFFELTQLSGLYGIYPHAYRLFDVDDLLMNTLGGVLGWAAAYRLLVFLPSRERIDAVNRQKSAKVGYIRRICALIIDALLVGIAALIVRFVLGLFLGEAADNYSTPVYYGLLALYLVFAHWIFGRTIGKAFVHIRLERREPREAHKRLPLPLLLLRYALVFLVIVLASTVLGALAALVEETEANGIYALMMLAVPLVLCIDPLVNLNRGKLLVYERLSRLNNVSTKADALRDTAV